MHDSGVSKRCMKRFYLASILVVGLMLVGCSNEHDGAQAMPSEAGSAPDPGAPLPTDGSGSDTGSTASDPGASPRPTSSFQTTPYADGLLITYYPGTLCGTTSLAENLSISDCGAILNDFDRKAHLTEFETTETVNAVDFGLVGDGVTDNTQAFRDLMGVSGRKIIVPAGDYLTGKFSIPSNTELILSPGVVIRDSGLLSIYSRLINVASSNVRIVGYGARVIANREDYTSGEYRHGVFLWGAHNVVIEGLASSSHGGDGFYIGGPPGMPSTDIVLIDCEADLNRRDALSITSAKRVDIIDAILTQSSGTWPQHGITMEMHDALDSLEEISIIRPRTLKNHSGGILIVVRPLDASRPPVSVKIIDHVSEGEPQRLLVFPGTSGVRGTISYGARTP